MYIKILEISRTLTSIPRVSAFYRRGPHYSELYYISFAKLSNFLNFCGVSIFCSLSYSDTRSSLERLRRSIGAEHEEREIEKRQVKYRTPLFECVANRLRLCNFSENVFVLVVYMYMRDATLYSNFCEITKNSQFELLRLLHLISGLRSINVLNFFIVINLEDL